MATWMYDGFPLKRADASTPGDDYHYVIQSLDAAIRHVFGIPTGTSLTPAFSIDSDGAVEILKSLSIGTEVLIDEIVDSIPTSLASDEDEQLATVNAIRGFIAEYVLNFLTDQDTFVEKAGDTMTGQLIANGGITGAGYLEIQNARFGGAQHPTLDYNTILQADNNTYDLIKYTDGVVVGDSSAVLHLAGSQPRVSYKSQQLCFLSDLVDYITDGSGLDYVPVLGGTFIGQVAFDSLIGLNQASGLAAYDVGLDSYTTVMSIEYDGDTPEYLRFWNISSIFNGQTKLGWDFADVNFAIFDGSDITIGDVAVPLCFIGDGTRPYFNGDAIALLSEVGGSYLAGDGIEITDLGGDVYSVALEANGITEDHMPAGNPGEYARLDSGGVLVFENLDLVEGTGIALVEVDGQFTINIDDEGVDTDQLAADAVDGTKIADDAVGYEHIDATCAESAGVTYTLTETDGVMEWVEGSGGGGSGSLLGTAEIISSFVEIPFSTHPGSGAYQTEASGSDGPYIIETVSYIARLAGSFYSVLVQVLVDGVTIVSSSLDDVGEYLQFPLYAKTSFEIKAKVASGATLPNDGGTVSWNIQRLE